MHPNVHNDVHCLIVSCSQNMIPGRSKSFDINVQGLKGCLVSLQHSYTHGVWIATHVHQGFFWKNPWTQSANEPRGENAMAHGTNVQIEIGDFPNNAHVAKVIVFLSKTYVFF